MFLPVAMSVLPLLLFQSCLKQRPPALLGQQPFSLLDCSRAVFCYPPVDSDLCMFRARRKDEAPLHVPGHKKGNGVHARFSAAMQHHALQCDLTEIAGLDYLSSPTGVIREAQQLAAAAFGADRTWFLVNGSTGGVHASVMATCRPGGYLLAARNCHLSAFNAMALAGRRAPRQGLSGSIVHSDSVDFLSWL